MVTQNNYNSLARFNVVELQDQLFVPTHLLMRNEFVRYVQKNPYTSAAASDKKKKLSKMDQLGLFLSLFPTSRSGCLELNGIPSLKFFKPFQKFLECWSESRITDGKSQSCKLIAYYDK